LRTRRTISSPSGYLLTGFLLLSAGEQAAAGVLTGFNVHASGGLSTYKSKMLQSNDTGTTINYGLALHAGEERGMSMGLEREQSTFPFSLNNASLALETQDVDVIYRWGPVYAGMMFTQAGWYAKAPADANGDKLLDQNSTAEEYLDILAPGYGARTGLRVAFSKRGAAYIDVRYATASKVQQATPKDASTGGIVGTSPALGRTVAVGPRMSVDFGASLPITRDLLSFIAGYRYRTYGLTVESESFAELHTSTYIGMTVDFSL
jgi:hypothetical protein